MFSATFFDVLIDHPDLYIHSHIPYPIIRRALIGIFMGLTALYILNSPFGKKSGAHINPSVTLVQYRLGNISDKDALWYVVFQCLGGAAGMLVIYLLMPRLVMNPIINYIVTKPGDAGISIAFILEFIISFVLMTTVLYTNSSKQLSKYTSWFVAVLIAVFITFEAPYSGMSMNPARSFASAIVANQWTGFWIYCFAPPLGMLMGEWFVLKILHKDLKHVTLHND